MLASSLTARALLIATAVSLVECGLYCPVGDTGHREYHFEGGQLGQVGGLDWGVDRPFWASNTPPWGYHVVVWVDPRPESEMVEFYSGSERLPIAGVYRRDIPNAYGCNDTGVVYDLSALPPGEYLLVHRRSSAPLGRESFWANSNGWESYEGEAALVMTLEMTRGIPDAGIADGGM